MMPSPEPITYYPPEPPIKPHIRTSDELLAAAEAILARPDVEIDEQILDQACKNIWDAVARRLRVFADAREWYYCEHGIAHQLVNRIDEALEPDPPELTRGFAVAEQLHRNFYDDLLEPAAIRRQMSIVQILCAALDDAHRRLPLDLAPPSSRRYKNAARRCAERRAQQAEASAG